MKRYWISWYSGYYEDEGCSEPPFQVWISGSRERPNHGLSDEKYAEYLKIEDEDEGYEFIDKHGRDTATICAMVEAESVDEIWQVVGKYFPDHKERFCEEQEDGAVTGDRFGNFEGKVSLYV